MDPHLCRASWACEMLKCLAAAAEYWGAGSGMGETRESKLFSRNFGVGNRSQISRPDIQEKVSRVSKIPFLLPTVHSSFGSWSDLLNT